MKKDVLGIIADVVIVAAVIEIVVMLVCIRSWM